MIKRAIASYIIAELACLEGPKLLAMIIHWVDGTTYHANELTGGNIRVNMPIMALMIHLVGMLIYACGVYQCVKYDRPIGKKLYYLLVANLLFLLPYFGHLDSYTSIVILTLILLVTTGHPFLHLMILGMPNLFSMLQLIRFRDPYIIGILIFVWVFDYWTF